MQEEAGFKRIQLGFGYVELEVVGTCKLRFLDATWLWKLELWSCGNT